MSPILNALKPLVLTLVVPPTTASKAEATLSAAPRVAAQPRAGRDVFVRGRRPSLPTYGTCSPGAARLAAKGIERGIKFIKKLGRPEIPKNLGDVPSWEIPSQRPDGSWMPPGTRALSRLSPDANPDTNLLFERLSLLEKIRLTEEYLHGKIFKPFIEKETQKRLEEAGQIRKEIARQIPFYIDEELGLPKPGRTFYNSYEEKLYRAEITCLILREFQGDLRLSKFRADIEDFVKLESARRLNMANKALKDTIHQDYNPDFDTTSWLEAHPEIKARFYPQESVLETYKDMPDLYRAQVDFIILSRYLDYYASLPRGRRLPPSLAPEPDFSRTKVIIPPKLRLEYEPREGFSISILLDIEAPETAPPSATRQWMGIGPKDEKAPDIRKFDAASVIGQEREIERDFGIKIDSTQAIADNSELYQRFLDEAKKVYYPKYDVAVHFDARRRLLESYYDRYAFYQRQVERLKQGFRHVTGDNPYLHLVENKSYQEPPPHSRDYAEERSRLSSDWSGKLRPPVLASDPNYLNKLEESYQASLSQLPEERNQGNLLQLVLGRWIIRNYKTLDGAIMPLQGVFADALIAEVRRHPELKLDVALDRAALEARIAEFEHHPDLKAWVEICLYEQAAFTGAPAPDGSLIKYENRDKHIKNLQKLSQHLKLDDETRLRLLGTLRARIEAEKAYPAASGKSAEELEKLKNQYVEDSVLKQRPFDKIFARAAKTNKLEIKAEELLAIKAKPMPPDWDKWARVLDALDAPSPASLEVDNPQLASLVDQGPIPWTVLIPGGSANPMQDSAVYHSEREFKHFIGKLPDSSGVKLHVDSSGVQIQQLAEKLKAKPTPILTLVTHGVPGPTPFDSAAFATRNPRVEVFRGLSVQVEAKLLDRPVSVPEFKQDAAQCFCATKKAATQMATAGGKTAMIPNSAIVNQVRVYQRDSGGNRMVGFVTGSCDGVELAADMIEGAGFKFALGFSGKVNARWTTKLLIDFTQRVEQGKPIKTALIEAQKALLEEAAKEWENRVQYQKLAWEVVENTYLFVVKESKSEATP